MFKISKLYLAILIVTFMAISPAYAEVKELGDVGEGNIKAGSLEIHPFVSVQGTYSDNIYQSYDEDKSVGGEIIEQESDFYTTVSPGIQFLLPIDNHSLQIGGRADIYNYSDFSENDHTDAIVGGILDLNLACDLWIKVSDFYSKTQVNRRWKEILDPVAEELYDERPYDSNDFTVKTKYSPLDNWAVSAWFDYAYDRYDEDQDALASDYDRSLVGGSLIYSITSKIDIFAEYNFSQVNYEYTDTYDNRNSMAYAGLEFDPTAKLNGYLKLGLANKDYTEFDVDYDTFSVLADLGYMISPYNVLELKAFRAIEEDIDYNVPLTKTDLSLSYRHIFAQNTKVALNTKIGYGSLIHEEEITIDSVTDEREDTKLYGGVGVDYKIQKWLILGADYAYVNNDSNFKTYDYTENRGTVGVTASF
jgi:hypothetical protein